MSDHARELALVQVWIAQLAIARQKRGWTQRRLAAELGTFQGTVSSWESGRLQPTTWNLIAWADVLGYELALFERTEE